MTSTALDAVTSQPDRRWLGALVTSSHRLRDLVTSMSQDQLRQPSFTQQWTVAQVLSHLGSAAEICTTLIERGLTGDTTGPQRDQVSPIWDRWNGLSPTDQRDQWLTADTHHLQLLQSLSAREAAALRVPYFSGLLTLTDYVGYRLSEQTLHGWDIACAITPAPVIPNPDLGLLWERIDLIATRFRDGATLERLRPQELTIQLTDTGRAYTLRLDAELHLVPARTTTANGTVAGTADTVLRLIYGRLRPGDALQISGEVSLDDLTDLFPGF